MKSFIAVLFALLLLASPSRAAPLSPDVGKAATIVKDAGQARPVARVGVHRGVGLRAFGRGVAFGFRAAVAPVRFAARGFGFGFGFNRFAVVNHFGFGYNRVFVGSPVLASYAPAVAFGGYSAATYAPPVSFAAPAVDYSATFAAAPVCAPAVAYAAPAFAAVPFAAPFYSSFAVSPFYGFSSFYGFHRGFHGGHFGHGFGFRRF